MLTVNIICVGKLKEKYWTQAIAEYEKRLSAFCKFNIIEVNEEKISDNPSDSQIQNTIVHEGERIESKLKKNSFVVSMCIEGKIISSEELSQMIEKASVEGFSSIDFIIGGSWGISQKLKGLSNAKISMGRMTFPHQLARVMLTEQIYRSFQISSHAKYHK